MSSEPFSAADCEAVFGPECAALKDREAREAPRFTPEQILRGKALFATFPICVENRGIQDDQGSVRPP